MCYNGMAHFTSCFRKKRLIMDDFKNKIISEIKKIYDPEIPVNIYDLGLIYKIDIDEKKKLQLR